MSRSFIRSLKNLTNGYSSVQSSVRNATSNDPWGPSTEEMHRISGLSYEKRYLKSILEILASRLNDKGRNYRHITKSLTILTYLVHEGSPDVLMWLKENKFIIRTLQEFTYIDDKGADQGQQVRTKAKRLYQLIINDDKLKTEKENRHKYREQMTRPGFVDNPNGTSDLDPRKSASFDIPRAVENNIESNKINLISDMYDYEGLKKLVPNPLHQPPPTSMTTTPMGRRSLDQRPTNQVGLRSINEEAQDDETGDSTAGRRSLGLSGRQSLQLARDIASIEQMNCAKNLTIQKSSWFKSNNTKN
ncbi:ENTH-domain-containing protein [Nadsonia fulvescens var. elongata DSM 6958]|uniref:ENTH-domain-containing protein n=1 Tax=Nadsonia fulvescens var. elongata DSM 6958 TaxID=857566 RepID=A0A1E3PCG3_9ASCO|nr:ENTH-domain-containing protein [Nadsonia fulvescens var. elongata DSM 6958]